MIEKALILALIAVALTAGASAIGSAFDRFGQRTSCAFDKSNICLIEERKTHDTHDMHDTFALKAE